MEEQDAVYREGGGGTVSMVPGQTSCRQVLNHRRNPLLRTGGEEEEVKKKKKRSRGREEEEEVKKKKRSRGGQGALDFSPFLHPSITK